MHAEDEGDEGEDVITPGGKLYDVTGIVFGADLYVNCGGQCQPRIKSLKNLPIETKHSKMGYGSFVVIRLASLRIEV